MPKRYRQIPNETPGHVLARRLPLWDYVDPGPEPGKLYLPGVKTYVYTVDRPVSRTGLYDRRQDRCREIMGAYRFTDWSFFRGEITREYYTTIWKGHIEILRRGVFPVLILEDDIEPRAWSANISVPEGTHVAMLGGGRWGPSGGIEAAIAGGAKWKRGVRYVWQDVDAEWMRVSGMWFTHAQLWLDPVVAEIMCRLWEEWQQPIDTVTGMNQWRFRWLCRRVPIFWQNDGHHFRDTYHYAPRS